ncbi:MAG: T9SS type A sorting domain-containing protein [Paludibacteraceae bacterium]|nr:T9SS type A sorting domain-containing protein [Paludibacteraceae bacterium]
MKKTLFLGMLFAMLPCMVGKAATGVFDPNAYTTISMTYSGQRFYLAVDTTAATPTLTCYTEPSLATMWQVSDEMEDPVLGSSRTIQSVWFAAQSTPETYYLRCTNYHVGYFDLRLEADGSLFYVEAKSSEPGKYLECNLFYYDVSQSIPAKYYLTYDAVFGFKRVYSRKPSSQLVITQWERKTGTDLAMSVTPNPVVFDFADLTTKQLPVQLTLVENADRFINKRDNTEQFYVQQGTTITDQEAIRDLIASTSVKWSSTNAAGESSIINHDKTTHLPTDTLTMVIADGSLTFADNYYYLTVDPEGRTPFEIYNNRGKPVDFSDFLRIKINMNNGDVFMDSVPVIRRTFHDVFSAPFNLTYTPNDASINMESQTLYFDVSGTYQVTTKTLYADGTVYNTSKGTLQPVAIDILPTIKDTAWVERCDTLYDIDPETEEPLDTWNIYCHMYHDGPITYIDTLLYSVSGGDWMHVTLSNRSKLVVQVDENTEPETRIGSITITYTYRYGQNSLVTATKTIYITQQGTNATASVTFEHNGTAKPGMSVQDVHEQVTALYAIPGAELQLPLRQDMYGWYRWYDYESDKQILIRNLVWNKVPQSQRGEFYNINTDPTHARGKFDYAPNFTIGQPTEVASINIPRDFMGGKVACDVSEYTNFNVNWTLVGQQGAVKEPTLSYRQIFDIHPASEQADRMEKCMKGSNNWMDKHDIMAPAGRVVKFQPAEKYVKGTNQDSELGYVYYFNMNDSDNIGKKTSVQGIDQKYAYMRVGLGRDTTFGIPDTYAVRLLSATELTELKVGRERDLILVAPNQKTGYVLARRGTTAVAYNPVNPTTGELMPFSTQAEIQAAVQMIADQQLNNCIMRQSAAIYDCPTLFKCRYIDQKFFRFQTTENLSYYYGIEGRGDEGEISFQAAGRIPDKYWDLTPITQYIPKYDIDPYNRLVSGCDINSLVIMHQQMWGATGTARSQFRYFMRNYLRKVVTHEYTDDAHCKRTGRHIYPPFKEYCIEYETWDEITYVSRLIADHEKDEDDIVDAGLTPDSKYAWQFYAVDTIHHESQSYHHEEHAKWYMSTDKGATWTELGKGGNTGVVNNDGSLDFNFANAADSVIIKLESEHFQLGYYVVNFYDPAKQVGPSTAALLTEDEIAQDYEPIWDFNSLYTPAGTTDMTVLNQHLNWGQSELGFHYPQSQIGDQRIFDQTLPAQGEYCLINTYEKDGKVIESRSGADKGVMLYVNSAKNPTTFWDFTYPQPTCSDQDIYFTCYVRNPHNSECHIRLFLEGQKGSDWELIANINSGILPANSGWQQILIPLTANIQGQGYSAYHFKFRITGATGTGETGILMDKIRMIGNKRPAAVYQANMTCGEEYVFAVARIAYPTLPEEMQGAQMCFQVSYKNSIGEYIPMNNSDMPANSGYYIDGFYPIDRDLFISVPDSVNNGFIVIPEATYDPSQSSTSAGQSTKLKAFLDQIKDGRTSYFINETERVFPNVEALCAATKDWGEKGGVRCMTKGYVKEKIAGVDTWVMYIVMKLNPELAADYRLRMTPLVSATTRPYFLDAACSTERFFSIKEMVSVLVDGNHVASGTSLAVPGNTAHTVHAEVNIIDGASTYLGSSKFDVLRLPEQMRGYDTLSGPELAAAEEAFKQMHHYSVSEVERALSIFHNPDEANPNRDGNREWKYVSSADFMYAGISEEAADSVYAILKSLNDNAKARLGMDAHAFTIGSNQVVCCWIRPIPASATYIKPGGSSIDTDTTISVIVCDNNQWLEFHAQAAPHDLRFGNDPRTEEEKNNIPIIRATHTQANTMLPVRVSEITNDPGNEVILGWDSTRLVATNDPRWAEGNTFRYAQDRILQAADYQTGYYKPGDTIMFTPVNAAHIELLNKDVKDGKNQWNVPVEVHPGYQTPNNFELEDGYWYRFQTTMMNLALSPYVNSDTLRGVRMGDAFFELYVIPDTLQWMPNNEDGANYWNDDRNWRAVVNGEPTGITRVPLDESQVIIDEQKGEHLYPIVDTDLHDNNDFGFKPATCRDILFRPNTRIKGQELLDYNRCFIDRFYTTGQWTTFSPALKFTHTGDMFTPADMETEAKMDFAPLRFDDPANIAYFKAHCAEWGLSESQFGRSYPFAYWQNAWNASVPATYYSTDEGTQQSRTRQSAEWVNMNTTNYHYEPGNGYAILCYGPTREDGETLLYRLPKQDQTYYAYHHKSDGSYEPYAPVDINRPDFEHQLHNMSFDKDTLNAESTGGLTIRLHNNTASNQFLFGNPSMGMIDVWKFVDENDLVEEVAIMSGNAWSTRTKAANPQLFLSPHDAMLIKAKTSGTALNVVLRPEYINIITNNSLTDNAPARKAEPNREGRLSIMAYNGGFFGHALLIESDHASNLVVDGEDAQALSSGLTNNAAFNRAYTPVNVFTLCEDMALTTDMRQVVNRIPLGFAWMNDLRGGYDNTTRLYFSVQGNWETPLYLVDVLTGDSTRIIDGGSIAVATPEANTGEVAENRYYIRGGIGAQPTTDEEHVVTDIDNINQGQEIGTNNVVVYDMTGRTVMTSVNGEYDLQGLSTGVYLVRCGNKVERKIVK